MTPEEEKYCLQELSAGNRQAFEWLFITWQPKLVDFFSRLLGDVQTASDYAQDVFFDIWTDRRKFKDVDNFSAYLFQMARFKSYNHFDRQAVQQKYRNVLSHRWGGQFPNESSEEKNLFASETEALIWEKVNQMPEKRRKVFIMSRFQGLSNEEIARALGISKRTVENHITTSLAELRKVVKFIVVLCVTGCLFYN